MTEAEWLACEDPMLMLYFLESKVSEYRKFRLLGVACCRRIAHLLNVNRWQSVLDAAELFDDGLLSAHELVGMVQIAQEEHPSSEIGTTPVMAYSAACDVNGRDTIKNTIAALIYTADALAIESREESLDVNMRHTSSWASSLKSSANLARDIFGNPFRPVTFLPEWRTPTVLALATGIYDEKAFDRMPILADALMDAGCDNEEILQHCRGPGPHTRGCWVCDLLLQKQ
jgi:hypothetical protein